MQHNDGAVRGTLDVLLHSLKVKADVFGVEVAVVLPFQASVVENVAVVAPGGVADVHVLARKPLGDEGGSHPQAASS